MHNDDLMVTFVEETSENLQSMEEGLLELERSPDNRKVIDVVFRAIHTIKGGAGLVGLSQVRDFSHELENLLDRIRQEDSGLSQQVFEVLFEGVDILKQLLSGDPLDDAVFEHKLHGIREDIQKCADLELKAEDEAAKVDELRYYRIDMVLRRDIFETGTDPLMLLLEVAEQGSVLESYLNVKEMPTLAAMDPYALYCSWVMFVETSCDLSDLENIFIFVRDENDIHIEDITNKLDVWFFGGDALADLMAEKGLISALDKESFISRQSEVGKQLAAKGKIVLTKVESAVKSQQVQVEQERISTIRVESSKLEQCLNSIAELLIAQSGVKEMVSKIPGVHRTVYVEIFNTFQEVDKIIRRVQEELMNISMIPIGATFSRFQRMVRDLLKEQGKKGELVLSGTETELDKKVIEQIVDPLKHLLRNSVDHGLESPEERTRLGKPEVGTIRLEASHQEGHFVIEIADDGRGINAEAVLRKARAKGLIEDDAELTESEMQRLIFLPGFSTAEAISDISGRGVGLDVVLTNIQNMRGNIEVHSEPGQGTRFVIKLPLTLAIIDGMIVRVGDERFIIPLTSISEFVKVQAKDVRRVESKGLIVNLRSEYIPYAALYQLLRLESQHNTPTDGILVIVKENRKKLALLVDEIIGQEQVVIKSMRDNLEHIDGMAGATILGDGRVAIILEVPSLFRIARRLNTTLDNANSTVPGKKLV